jgi:hypothetical protein
MENFIFPILAFEDSKIMDVADFISGTGFLINDKGYLYTAGHNFYKKDLGTGNLNELTCFAFIKNELIEIERIYVEYDKNSEGEKKDFAIGKLKSLPKELTSNVNVDNEDYLMVGYSIRDLPFEIIETINFRNTLFNLYKVPITPTGNVLKYYSINISYDNVLFFDCSPKVDFYGLSGCPIFKNNELCGMLVSNCFITYEYLEKIANNNGKIKTST